jgi:hypothetical protein
MWQRDLLLFSQTSLYMVTGRLNVVCSVAASFNIGSSYINNGQFQIQNETSLSDDQGVLISCIIQSLSILSSIFTC